MNDKKPGKTKLVIVLIVIMNSLAVMALKAQEAAGRPNILFISSDDLNDWIGVLNTHPQVLTPNIDRLAKRGTLFTNAHTQAPLCNPSRVSIMTGLRPSTTGIYGLSPRHREVERTKDVVTLPQYFSTHGYRTLSAGKVFDDRITPIEREVEFQEWGSDGGYGPMPEQKIVKAPLDMVDHPLVDWGVFPQEEDSLIQDYEVATWAVKKLEQLGAEENREEPFFMAVGFRRPHVPLFTTHNPGNHSVRSERWRYIRYANGSEELYDHLRDKEEWANLADYPEYAGVIEELAAWLPNDDAPTLRVVKTAF